jgi:hypothetical protein
MFCVSSLPCLTSSFSFRYHYLRWTSLIIHPAMFASWSERAHRSYDILGRERGGMFCISYLHTFILQAASKVLRLGMRSRLVFRLSFKPEKEKGELNSLTPSGPSKKSLSAMSGGYLAFEKLSRTKGYIRFWHRHWLSWASAMSHNLSTPGRYKIYVFTFKRVIPSKSSEECNGPLEQNPQSCE